VDVIGNNWPDSMRDFLLKCLPFVPIFAMLGIAVFCVFVLNVNVWIAVVGVLVAFVGNAIATLWDDED
jgi:hypothetical protein